MRKSLVEDAVLKQNKMSDMSDKSAAVYDKTVHVISWELQWLSVEVHSPFFFNLVQVKFSAHAKVIYDAVLCKLIFHWSTKKMW